MANTLGAQMTKLDAGTPPDPGFVDGSVRVFCEEVTLAGQGAADTIEVARLPKGAVPLYGVLSTDTSLAAANIAIGVSGTAGKYRASAALTAVDSPEVFGVVAGVGGALTAEETVIISPSAALPGSGTLRVMMAYAFN